MATICKKGDIIARIEGPARSVLSGERVGLNFMMHLSGIATYTSVFAAEIAHTKARVTCTRKTLPGLRAFAKYRRPARRADRCIATDWMMPS